MENEIDPKLTDEQKADHQKIYNEFWKELIEVDGVLDLDLMKAELRDFKILIDIHNELIPELTNGMMSGYKLYFASSILDVMREEHERSREYTKEDLITEFGDPEKLQEELNKTIPLYKIGQELYYWTGATNSYDRLIVKDYYFDFSRREIVYIDKLTGGITSIPQSQLFLTSNEAMKYGKEILAKEY